MTLSKAKNGWRKFHQKDEPRKLIQVKCRWPDVWELVGFCKTTYYTSDKWVDDGHYRRYYHDHGPGVRCYQPVGEAMGLGELPRRRPRVAIPKEAFVLGYSLGWDIEVEDGIVRAEPPNKARLCAYPNCRTLFVLSGEDVVALFRGKGLRVADVGIVG